MKKESNLPIKCRLFDERIIRAIRSMSFGRNKKQNLKNFIIVLIKSIEMKQCTQIELESELKISRNSLKSIIKMLRIFRVCFTTNLVRNKGKILSFNVSQPLIQLLPFLLNDFRCTQLLTMSEFEKLTKKVEKLLVYLKISLKA